MSESSSDLALLLRLKRQQTLEEMAQLRDDMRVVSAIVMRLDGTVGGLLTELRAMHGRHDRMERRVRALEDHQPQ